MAYRVLVADDEELERRALRFILGGEGMPGIEVLEAANGREALEHASRGHLDAAFLDIRMPGIDGIEAARLLRERYPELPIVFLTAHDSFEYARSALRLRVEDFLLKPASAQEVSDALFLMLARVSGAAQEGGSSLGADSRATERLESAVAFLAQDIRDALGSGEVPVAAILRYLGLAGSPGPISAVVALRAEALELEGSDARRRALRGAAGLAERLLSTRGRLAFAGAGAERALCIVARGAVAQGATVRGAVARGATALCAAEASSEAIFGQDEMRVALEELAERGRAELGIDLAIGAAVAAPCPAPEGEDSLAASACELAAAARRAAALAGPARPVIVMSLAAGDGVPREREREDTQAGARTARLALELIEARHADDLSLETVAAELCVSASHLSRLLGRHAGLGFADCLARFRVERAKAFLASGTMSVKEAAVMVGFRDPAYFARVFRRFAGLSPTEYRRAAARGERSARGDREGGI